MRGSYLALVSCMMVSSVIGPLVAESRADATLFLESAGNGVWSPDGGKVACVRCFPNWNDDRNCQIWLAPVGGAPTQLTTDNDGAFSPLWLAGGNRIVYSRFRFGDDLEYHQEFVVIDLQGGDPVVWEVPQIYNDLGVALGPDGHSVLYSLESPPETWSLDLDTGARQLVVAAAGGVLSPDGQWIVYIDAQDRLVLGPRGQEPTLVLGRGLFPAWTPDGQYLVFSRLDAPETLDLVVVRRDGRGSLDLTDDAPLDWYSQISPQGNKVLYTRSVSELAVPELWIMDLTLPPVATAPTTWSQLKRIYR